MKYIIILLAFILMSGTIMYQGIRHDSTLTGEGTTDSPLGIASSFSTGKIAVTDTATMLTHYIDRASAETIYGVKTFNADPIVPAEAYASGWNGSNEPPTKNDTYDKIETLVTSASSTANQIAYITGANTISGRTTFTDDGTTLTHKSASNGTGGNFRLSRADGNPVIQMGTYSGAFPGYGGYWGGNITPSGTNYAFISDGTSETIFNGVTLKFRISHANAMVVNSSSDVGVGIDAASARLHLLKTTEQLRVGYDASNYFSTTVGSSGIVTLNAVGSGSSFKFSDPVLLQGYTVATLPTGVTGMTAYVTDATAPTYLGALTGGGAVTCPVFYNGTAWVSH